jgi:hypothetical protein
MGLIYEIEICDKFYVGSTKYDLIYRKKRHERNCFTSKKRSPNRKLYVHWRNNGLQNAIFRVIENDIENENLRKTEQKWINIYKEQNNSILNARNEIR